MKIAVVLMAAGESARFGECKSVAKLSGSRTLIESVYEQASASGVGDLHIVTGRWHRYIEELKALGTLPFATLLYCEQWQRGLGHSIASAVNHLSGKYDAVLIALADQVALTPSDYRALADKANKAQIVCAEFDGKLAPPALFPALFFEQLTQLDGEHGARKLLRGGHTDVIAIPLPSASIDIDTKEDLARWNKSAL